MQFRQMLVRLVIITLFVVAIGVVMRLLLIQQRLPSLTEQNAPSLQAEPSLTAPQEIDNPVLPIPNTPDLSKQSVPVDTTPIPDQSSDMFDCGGASQITGVVLLPDGSPATNAAVQREWGSPADCWAALTNERGEFVLQNLAAGTWVLRAWPHVTGDATDTMPLYRSPFVTITVDGINTFSLPAPIQLTGAQLVGQIKLASGQPGSAIPVEIVKVIGDPDCSLNAAIDPNGVGTISDESGHFQIGGLPTIGLHCIRIALPNSGKLIFSRFVIVDTPQIQIDLGVITTSALSKHVTGTILDSNGQGISGTMSAGRLGDGPDIGFLIETDENGHYAIDLEPGAWEVYIFPRDGELANLPLNDRMQVVTFAEDEREETQVVDFVLPRSPVAQPLTLPSTQQIYTVFMPISAK